MENWKSTVTNEHCIVANVIYSNKVFVNLDTTYYYDLSIINILILIMINSLYYHFLAKYVYTWSRDEWPEQLLLINHILIQQQYCHETLFMPGSDPVLPY